ncbi:MAG: flippase [Candidatus Eisenbacteria bacterium]
MAANAQVDAAREVPGAMLWSLVARVLVTALAIGSNIMIVRGLGEYAYGVYSIYLNIAHFLVLLIGIGTGQAVLRFLPELWIKQDAHGTRALLRRAMSFHLISWLAILALMFPLRGLLSELQHADLRTILPLGIGLLIGEAIWGLLASVYTALRRMAWLALASVVQKLALIALLILFLRREADVTAVLWVVAGSFALGILLLVPGLPRILPRTGGATDVNLGLRRMLNYALPVAVTGLISQIIWRSSETLIIGYYHRPQDVGFYNAAYNLAQMALEFVPLAVWPVILGALSEVHARREELLARGVDLYFRLVFVLVLPVAVSGFVFGGQLYRVMYGPGMAPGAMVCQALFLVLVPGFFATPLRMGLFVRERTRENLWIAGAGAVVNLALDFLLIPRYGMWGGVVAVGVALAFSAIVQYVYTRRAVPGLAVPWRSLGKVLLASLVVLPFWFWRERFDRPLTVLAAFAGAMLLQFLVLRALRAFGNVEQELLLRSNVPFRKLWARLLGGPR